MFFLVIFVFLSLLKTDCVIAKDCIFCNLEIVESQSVFEGEYLRILVDYAPRVKGHLLIFPKRHIVKAHEMSREEWEEFSIMIPKAVKFFSEYLNTDQYIVLEKNGPNAFQDIPHVHFHLFPVTNQRWAQIFDIEPKQLSLEDLKNEIETFRSYFLDLCK